MNKSVSIQKTGKVKRSKKQPLKPIMPDIDLGTDGVAALQRPVCQDVVDLGDGRPMQPVRRLLCECMLDYLYKRKNATLSDEQYAAGIRFRKIWHQAIERNRITARYEFRLATSSNYEDGSISYLNARHHIEQALSKLTKAQQRSVIGVCAYDECVGLRYKSLRKGLDNLAIYWHIGKNIKFHKNSS